MTMLGFLIAFPLVIAAILLAVRNNAARNVVVVAAALVIALASIWLVAVGLNGSGPRYFEFSSPIVDGICTIVGIVVAVTVICFGVKYKNPLAVVLAVVQLFGSLVFELNFAHGIEVPAPLYYDQLTLLMVFIIGVIGSAICVYALGYMEDFQAHEPEGAPDRRPTFFALMFVFLSAMYVIVFSDHLTWLFTGWEVTTLCSFLLIAYTRTEEAIRNAFRQIVMNLLGGLSFLVGLFACVLTMGTLSLAEFLAMGQMYPQIAVLAVTAFAFAGITKAAQMPFHTWLLGAMVAPTPTSALLHSSTMVKAGVFLLVKLAPVLALCPVPGGMLMFVGGLTFLVCSLLAITQSNAKRVLAYSTIANLGLITACAGVGTPEAVWAAMFLILFHAIAKSLLFLCVGTAEHHIGSRDIEDMDLLFDRMPSLARFMMLGIMTMFIAPFGMLISKWATLQAFTEAGNVVLVLLLAFGSAATFMFWAKWMGKLSGIAGQSRNVELSVHASEWVPIMLMAVLIALGCVGMPLISINLVEPYLYGAFGTLSFPISFDNLIIAGIAVILMIVVIFAGLGHSTARKVDVYLSGISVDNNNRTFKNSLSGVTQATARNWYMKDWLGEQRLDVFGTVACSVFIVALYVFAALIAAGLF